MMKILATILTSTLILSCGSSPVKEDIKSIERIHLLGVVFVGPNTITQDWNINSRNLAKLQQSNSMANSQFAGLANQLGIDPSKRNLQADVIVRPSGSNYDPQTYHDREVKVQGACKNCNQKLKVNIPARTMKVNAGKALERLLLNQSDSPFAPSTETRKISGFFQAKRLLDQKAGSAKSFNDPQLAQDAYGLFIRSSVYRQLLQRNPRDSFVTLFVYLKPEIGFNSVEKSGTYNNRYGDSFKMDLDVKTGIGSYRLNGSPVGDMRYAVKPETNLFQPPNQGCLPTILQLNDFQTQNFKVSQSRPARIISVDWENIAKGMTSGVVFQVDGGSEAYVNASSSKIQQEILKHLPGLSSDITTRVVDYLNNVRDD